MLRRLAHLLAAAMILSALVPADEATASSSTDGSIIVTGASGHSAVDRTDFTRFDCRYVGEADALPYVRLSDGEFGPVAFDVTCSLILPSNPDDWNGQIVVEPLDVFAPVVPDGEVARFLYIGEDLLFGGKKNQPRSGYASIGYQAYGPVDSIDQDQTIDEDFDGFADVAAASVEIFADFTSALRGGGNSSLIGPGTQYGPVELITTVGLSNQAAAIRGAMQFGEEQGFAPFDGAMPMAVSVTLTPNASGLTAVNVSGPVDFGSQKALFVNTEGEVAANGTFDVFGLIPVASSIVLRVEADDENRFIYEIAGASHIDPVNQADIVAIGLVPPGSFDQSNPLDWTPVRRAIFTQLLEWLVDGTSPEPSQVLDPPAAMAAPDPAYPGHPSVEEGLVNRDSDNNATGGIRLPNLQLGVATYLAIGPPMVFADPTTEFFQWLAGGFIDLSCTANGDGSPRFNSHGHYVGKYTKLANALAKDRFL
ncbi:MAG: alpha/beta hydrolase domain-containing protein, partial [Acidimicrobiales bacterium]